MATFGRQGWCRLCGGRDVIFLTVGTQLPFDRLVRSVDIWAGEHPDKSVFAQIGMIGVDGYRPKHMEYCANMSSEAFSKRCAQAELIVAHAGTGSLIKAQTFGTPILAMPRKAAFGEHRNDHQLATVAHFEHRSGIHVVYEETQVAEKIDDLLSGDAEPIDFEPYAEARLIETLRSVIFQNE